MKYLFIFMSCMSAQYSFSAISSKAANSTLTIDHNDKEVQFKIEPHQGLAISKDAPWSLDLSNINSNGTQQLTFKKNSFDEIVPVFKVSLSEIQSANLPSTNKSATSASSAADLTIKSFNYKLTAFICTIDKTKCFRDVIKGEALLTK